MLQFQFPQVNFTIVPNCRTSGCSIKIYVHCKSRLMTASAKYIPTNWKSKNTAFQIVGQSQYLLKFRQNRLILRPWRNIAGHSADWMRRKTAAWVNCILKANKNDWHCKTSGGTRIKHTGKKKNIEGSKMQRKKNESGKKGSYDRRGKGGRHVCAVRDCLGVCRP